MTCRGLNCTSTELIEAHIIPKGFGRLIRDGEGPNIKLTTERVSEANPQLGDYDPAILCEKCDNVLGLNDEYALEVCRDFKANNEKSKNDLFEVKSVDCERFSKFVLSVLWRASISRRKTFAEVSL